MQLQQNSRLSTEISSEEMPELACQTIPRGAI
jgi:hypothetical protein